VCRPAASPAGTRCLRPHPAAPSVPPACPQTKNESCRNSFVVTVIDWQAGQPPQCNGCHQACVMKFQLLLHWSWWSCCSEARPSADPHLAAALGQHCERRSDGSRCLVEYLVHSRLKLSASCAPGGCSVMPRHSLDENADWAQGDTISVSAAEGSVAPHQPSWIDNSTD